MYCSFRHVKDKTSIWVWCYCSFRTRNVSTGWNTKYASSCIWIDNIHLGYVCNAFWFCLLIVRFGLLAHIVIIGVNFFKISKGCIWLGKHIERILNHPRECSMNPLMIVIDEHKLVAVFRQNLCCIIELEMNNREENVEILRWNIV